MKEIYIVENDPEPEQILTFHDFKERVDYTTHIVIEIWRIYILKGDIIVHQMRDRTVLRQTTLEDFS